MTAGSCGAHSGFPDDLRETALHLLDRLRGALEPLAGGTGRQPDPGSPGACPACPVCALVAVLRGERSELAESLAVHAKGLLAVLVAVLEQDAARAPDTAAPPGPGNNGPGHDSHGHDGHTRNGQSGSRTHGGRSVQRIVVHRT
ncbi:MULTISPECIES: hypothetical protein [Pseudonocardia]|uniref:Uncharacterized protein n=2 Tax=Pseudonocardia TaxID=1847 RepID=A0A1Y2MQ46_PSEAH|nr:MULTISPECIES: hypothetical protein [Pseudonocardia]OSY37291.1 hypothetical protein BG845_04802 [Pseudonocardia autotrophica]TDN72412.1 hypothetical protein C8E95_1469 [Pseudonocardia autotrophica]BBG03121.1 hypothetical protein Pdca_43300 [Pseudonocardia autotrophica]GEC23740.1 hypothetical protein PSA01_07690 [Pseudonocardia saturnea]